MSRHPVDHHDGESRKRAGRFSGIERKTSAEGSHPAAKQLHRRPKTRTDGARLKAFARVERGAEA
jgi:hypothetical protein